MLRRVGKGLEKKRAAGLISGQNGSQVFVVEDIGYGENWGGSSGGLRRWCSGGLLGGVWAGLVVSSVGNFRRWRCWVLLRILGGWRVVSGCFGCEMEGWIAGILGEIGGQNGSDFGRCLGSGLSRTKGKEILVFSEEMGRVLSALSGRGSARKNGVSPQSKGGVPLWSGCWFLIPFICRPSGCH